ncbi:MAG TPA: hypothetical protein VF395_00680 [Polyangiaceae bacterium]
MPWPGSLVFGVAVGALGAVAVVGCGGASLPDPRVTAAEYGAAAAKGDARAVHALMTEEARRTYGEEGTKRLLADARDEITRQASAFSSPAATVRVEAEVPYVDGERAIIEVSAGHYRVSAASGLPAAARTPTQALLDLRAALARRSYPALVRLLSEGTRTAMERDLSALVTGLENPESLEVKVHGDAAEVVVPGGHKVRLAREAGVWRIHDFD